MGPSPSNYICDHLILPICCQSLASSALFRYMHRGIYYLYGYMYDWKYMCSWMYLFFSVVNHIPASLPRHSFIIKVTYPYTHHYRFPIHQEPFSSKCCTDSLKTENRTISNRNPHNQLNGKDHSMNQGDWRWVARWIWLLIDYSRRTNRALYRAIFIMYKSSSQRSLPYVSSTKHYNFHCLNIGM